MVTKPGKDGGPEAAQGPDMAANVKESAQQIWLAGLGAFSKAQAEGGKVFESLVKQGLDMQRQSQSAAQEKLHEAGSRMSRMASELSGRATGQWDKLETIFEERVAKSLHRLGVPLSKDLEALHARLSQLEASVQKLAIKPVRQARPVAPKAKPASKPVAKSAVKTPVKTARRKSA